MANNVEDFFVEQNTVDEPVAAVVTNKKRKLSSNASSTINDDLKKRARLFCKCPEQWRSVSRYNPKRLREFVDEQSWTQEQALHGSIFGFVHKLLGLVMDTISKGDGCVQREIEDDISLRQAIEQEGATFAHYLTNRYKIIALTACDTFNGKRMEIQSRPPDTITTVEEIKDNDEGGQDENVVAEHPLPEHDDTNIDPARDEAPEEDMQV